MALGLGSLLMLVGQILSVLVFYRLGRVGIFFGDRLGYEVGWCRARVRCQVTVGHHDDSHH